MIEPLLIEIENEGKIYKFNLSKFPAIQGREIITNYPLSNMPKLGDYKVSEEIMLKLMSFIERVYDDGNTIQLANRALVDNHVPNWEVLVQLEMKMIEYNCSFFRNGKALDFLKKSTSLAESKITETLTALLGKLSQVEKPRSKN